MTNKIHIQVLDGKTNAVKQSIVQPFNSFNMNFMAYLMRHMGGEFTTTTHTTTPGQNPIPNPAKHPLASKNVYGHDSTATTGSGVVPVMPITGNFMAPFDVVLGDRTLTSNTAQGSSTSHKGIAVGTDSTPFDYTQHALNYIRHGQGTGELYKHVYVVRYDFTNASSPFISMERLFINKTLDAIDVRELGILANNVAGPSFDYPPAPGTTRPQSFLVARDVVPTITVTPGDVLRVQYSIGISGNWKPAMLSKMIEWISGKGTYSVQNTAGTLTEGALNLNTLAEFGNSINGVVLGTDGAVPHTILPDQVGPGLNALGSQIAHGISPGQLVYGDSVVHEVTVSGTFAYFDVERAFYNYDTGTSQDVIVGEVGVYVGEGTNNVMLFRKPLPEPVVIPPDEGKVFTIRIKTQIA